MMADDEPAITEDPESPAPAEPAAVAGADDDGQQHRSDPKFRTEGTQGAAALLEACICSVSCMNFMMTSAGGHMCQSLLVHLVLKHCKGTVSGLYCQQDQQFW